MSRGDTYCLRHGWEPCDCAGAKPRIRKPSLGSLPSALKQPPAQMLATFDDDVTPPRRPSSIARIQLWGLVELWLAENDARGLVMRVSREGMIITATDPVQGTRSEIVRPNEDPSRTVMRAVAHLGEET